MNLFLFCLYMFILLTASSKSIFKESEIEIYLHFRSSPEVREESDLVICAIEKRLKQKPKKLNKMQYIGNKIYKMFQELERGEAAVIVYVFGNGKGEGMVERLVV